MGEPAEADLRGGAGCSGRQLQRPGRSQQRARRAAAGAYGRSSGTSRSSNRAAGAAVGAAPAHCLAADLPTPMQVERAPGGDGMSRYILQRLLGMAAVMFIVVTVVFVIVRVTPGDPAAVMLGPDATAAEVAALREQPRPQPADPRPVRLYFGQMLRGDLGQSIFLNKPVLHGPGRARRADPVPDPVGDADRRAIAVPIGILAAYRRGSAVRPGRATLAMTERQHPELLAGPGGAADDRGEARAAAGGRLRAARRRLPRAHAAPDPAGRWCSASSARH